MHFEETLVIAVLRAISVTLAMISDLAEGEFLLEFSTKLTVTGNELLADIDKSLTRGDGSVSLDPEKHFGYVGVTDYVDTSVSHPRSLSGIARNITYSCSQPS
jgi:hypothetical protein